MPQPRKLQRNAYVEQVAPRRLGVRKPEPRARKKRLELIDRLMARCDDLAAMDFEFLYDPLAPAAQHRL